MLLKELGKEELYFIMDLNGELYVMILLIKLPLIYFVGHSILDSVLSIGRLSEIFLTIDKMILNHGTMINNFQ